jgi:hypothetical protein
MGFRAERKRLGAALRSGEDIVASDRLSAIEERPELTVVSHPVLVVTNMSAYIVLSGKPQEVRRIEFDAIAVVTRTDDRKSGGALQLTMTDGEVLTLLYDPRDPLQAAGDLITERFFGRIVKDTARDLPPSPSPAVPGAPQNPAPPTTVDGAVPAPPDAGEERP